MSNKRLTQSPEDWAREQIERALASHGDRSTTAIANITGLSRTTVYNYVRKGSTKSRMQLPTFAKLAQGKGLFYK